MVMEVDDAAVDAGAGDVVTLAVPADRAHLLQRLLAWPPAFLLAWAHAGEIALLERPVAAGEPPPPQATERVQPGAKGRYRVKQCAVCGIEFLGSAHARYCSTRCRVRAHNERHRDDHQGVGEQSLDPGTSEKGEG